MPAINPGKWFRKGEQPVEHEGEVPTALETQPETGFTKTMRRTDYPENLVNLITFYLSYLLMLGSAVVIIYFSLQKESSFTQEFAVQPFPTVVYAWNANPAATTLPPASDSGSGSGGGRATCSPHYYERGTRLEYACTSIATDARESLSFSLYSTIPYPATFKTYRSPTLRYPDIEVPTYYIKHSTYLAPATVTVSAATFATSTAATEPTSMPPSPSATQASAASSVTVTAAPAALQARQAGSASSSVRLATASAGSPALQGVDYASASISAIARGTIVSTMPTPTSYRIANTVYMAKMKGGLYTYFVVVACLAVALATPTFLLVNYNLAVARKKVFPREIETLGEPSTTEQAKTGLDENNKTAPAVPRPRTVQIRNVADQARQQAGTATAPIFEHFHAMGPQPAPAPAWTASLPQYVRDRAVKRQRAVADNTTNTTQRRTASPDADTRTREATNDIELQPRTNAETPQQEEAPPAYHERHNTRGVPQWLTTRLGPAAPADEDDIEVDEPSPPESLASIDTEEALERFQGGPVMSVFRRPAARPDVPLQVRTDGTRLSLRLSWMILPTYAFVFFWDGLAFLFVLIAEITAVGLVADPMVDVGSFVRSGGCFGKPADKDSVYDLQRQLCTRFLSIFPVTYSDISPAISLTKVGGDLLAVTLAMVVLFVAQLTWHITLFRKSHLAGRDGMDPKTKIGDKAYTGKTRWGYMAVCESVGSHGWRAGDIIG
ncbi:hypothetical protein sr12116 [Sporisorium reilianum SRZ2]|uniref:Uncharacterized protein n=1 Tax=Sporisorium reilianum (strain SRZ2) TaxID=999809 RepID=E6ZLP7_SPORE|nr:hypothetical protein sr12116 [Sporisorium reilianum SRZ2]